MTKHTEYPTHGRREDSFHPEGSTMRALVLLDKFCDDVGVDNPVGWLGGHGDGAYGSNWSHGSNCSHAEVDGDDKVVMYSKPFFGDERRCRVIIEIDTDADGGPDGWRDLARVTRFTVEECDD